MRYEASELLYCAEANPPRTGVAGVVPGDGSARIRSCTCPSPITSKCELASDPSVLPCSC